MTPDQVLQRAPLVLDQRARERYFEDGFLTVPGYVGRRLARRGSEPSSRPRSRSRARAPPPTISSTWRPITRRRSRTSDGCARRWTSTRSCGRSRRIRVVVDLVADLLGPDLRFHSSKLNFKWSDGGDAVRWHQDIQAWPHTNFGVLTFGVYLEDTALRAGPADRDPRHAPRTDLRPVRRRRPVDGRRSPRATSRRCPPTRPSSCAGRRAPSCCSTAAWCTARPRTTRRGCGRCCSTCTRPPTRCRSRRRRRRHRRRACWCADRSRPHVHMEPYPARLPPRWDQVGYRSIFAAQTTAVYSE